MILFNARMYYIAKLSQAMKWLKIKLPLSFQICPVIDRRLTVECPSTSYHKGIYECVALEMITILSRYCLTIHICSHCLGQPETSNHESLAQLTWNTA